MSDYKAILFIAAWLLLFLQSCDNEQVTEVVDFGADYQVLIAHQNPFIINKEAHIKVGYSGCEAEQDFELQGRINEDAEAELWLHKITPDQLCDAYFEKELIFEVPDYFLTTNAWLLSPEGGRLSFHYQKQK